MPGSHPSYSPRIASDPNRETHDAVNNHSDMLLDSFSSRISSPGESSANTSGRNSIDHGIRGSANYNGSGDIDFVARYAEFARSTRRDASSERPVIETFIDNEDYQSLLAAVSDIRVSQSPRNLDSDLSPPLLEDNGNGRSGNSEHDGDDCTGHPASSINHIYDLQHIMVHNQRQLENQMMRSRQEYARQMGNEIYQSPGLITLDNSSSTRVSQTDQLPQISYQSNFDPRPTISSSYFSPTTESTIVLSSPPPGRSSITLPSHINESAHSNETPSSQRSMISNNGRNTLTRNNGQYRPFVTGSDLSVQQPPRQQEDNATVSSPTSETISQIFRDRSNDGGWLTTGESNAGHWSMYGSLVQRMSSIEHNSNQHLEPSRDSSAIAADITFMMNTIEDQDSRSDPSTAQHFREVYRRNQYTPGSLPYPTSSIPIPSRYVNPQAFNHTNYAPVIPQYPPSFHRTSASGDSPLRYESVDQPRDWASSRSTRYGGSESRPRQGAGSKEVVRMACRFCESIICERGMKAQLLADQSVALLSTDDAPQSVQLVGDNYKPTNCMCKINDTACLCCGNAIGYHISQPCEKCLSSENNGHVWLFHPEYVLSMPRWNYKSSRPLRWSELPEPDDDLETLSLHKVQLGGPHGSMIVGGMVRREYDAICR